METAIPPAVLAGIVAAPWLVSLGVLAMTGWRGDQQQASDKRSVQTQPRHT
jgi:hypothetical protein